MSSDLAVTGTGSTPFMDMDQIPNLIETITALTQEVLKENLSLEKENREWEAHIRSAHTAHMGNKKALEERIADLEKRIEKIKEEVLSWRTSHDEKKIYGCSLAERMDALKPFHALFLEHQHFFGCCQTAEVYNGGG